MGDIETAIMKKLRNRTVAQGVSVGESRRRLLRSAPAGKAPGLERDFIEYLRGIPPEETGEFPRASDQPRKISP